MSCSLESTSTHLAIYTVCFALSVNQTSINGMRSPMKGAAKLKSLAIVLKLNRDMLWVLYSPQQSIVIESKICIVKSKSCTS